MHAQLIRLLVKADHAKPVQSIEADTLDGYLDIVQSEIEWKRAKKPAVLELREYIEDRKFDLMLQGYADDQMEAFVLEELEDPHKVGKKLNQIHRPQWNWPLLMCIGTIIVLGISLNLFCGGAQPVSRVIVAYVLGIGIMAIVWFANYVYIFTHFRIVQFIFLLVGLFACWLDLRHGWAANRGQFFIVFATLFLGYMTSVLHCEKSRNKIQISLGIMLVPLVYLSAIGSKSGIILCGIVIFANLVGLLKERGFSWKWGTNLFIYLLILWGCERVADLRLTFQNYNLEYVSNYYKSLQIWGKTNLDGISPDLSNYLILHFGSLVGKSGMFVLLLLYIALCAFLFFMSRKQELMSNKWSLIFVAVWVSAQVICAFINATGTAYLGGFDLPFVSTGFRNTFCNFCLFGFVLSIMRHETINVDLERSMKNG